jgi:SAM-dependent MidA family methyltransferase
MTPDPRPPSTERPAQLAAVIRAEIQSNPDRRITFARYMERALYEPDLGYYRQPADRPTDTGDFLTAPETHSIFGWTVARRIEAMWAELGGPRPFDLIEYGAGSGTLALSILDGMRRHGEANQQAADLKAATRYQPVESNPYRLADLRERFEGAGLAGLLAATGAPSIGSVPVTGVILANEFLDALPVHRFVIRGGKLLELYVAWQDGFVEVAGEPSTPALADRLAGDGVRVDQLAEGQVGEISLGLGEWLRGVATGLERGYVLVIDYGHDATELYGPRRLAGTLLGYRGHRVVENPFEDPGLVDLTAHVDFTALERLAAASGFRTVSSTTQSEFLVAAGLEEELRALQSSPDLTLADYTRARSGIVRMLDPRHMGRFRVLVLERA